MVGLLGMCRPSPTRCVYVYMCICVYVYMCICVYVYMYMCVCVSVCLCVCVSVCVCVFFCFMVFIRGRWGGLGAKEFHSAVLASSELTLEGE